MEGKKGREMPACPVCGQALGARDEVYTLGGGDLVGGCSRCLHAHWALEWFCEAERAYGEEQRAYWGE